MSVKTRFSSHHGRTCVAHLCLFGLLKSRDSFRYAGAGKDECRSMRKKHHMTLVVRRETNAKRNAVVLPILFFNLEFRRCDMCIPPPPPSEFEQHNIIPILILSRQISNWTDLLILQVNLTLNTNIGGGGELKTKFRNVIRWRIKYRNT